MRKPFTIWSAWSALAALSLLPAILTPARAYAALIQLNGTDTGSGGLSAETLHAWRTNVKSSETKDWFITLSDISPTNRMFSGMLQPGCVYSVTTTTGQAKGSTPRPPAAPLVLPYREDFHSYTPRLFSDQQGTFAVAAAGAGRKGKCLRQVVTLKPVQWSRNGDPSTVAGDSRWADYQVSSDTLLEESGYVDIVGRMMNITSGHSNLINGCP